MRVAVPILVGIAVAGCQPQQFTTSADSTFNTDGGTLVAHCTVGTIGQATIVSATPHDGFTAELVVPGPSNQASVYFVRNDAPDVRAFVTCSGGAPQVQVKERERNDYVLPQ